MNRGLVLLASAFWVCLAGASALSEADTGTYVILDRAKNPTDMFYRLSRSGDKWVMEGKKPGGRWANISCDAGCEYRTSTEAEIKQYFPADQRASLDFACIQNMAQAFCRYLTKENPNKGGYVVVALVTGQPIPVLVRRVPS
ncbi:hypothetical protein [Azohydromonas australica]|uniref:hypothetical protein n=1 Tax=Azohydromonas australica TaxID=364039 RepID=UPI0009FD1591|nr:hypothetical protein [Azohydromonas australica]